MSRYLNSPREADWYACPSCGDEVRVGSSGCPRCNSRKPTPDEDGDDSVDLSHAGEEFDYEDWKKREFGTLSSRFKPHHLPWKYWVGGILLIIAFVWAAVFAGFVHH
ncbi:MAG: hypothetical protein EOP86_05395 [Verrucomicrobiaceae bacterium]|nr:MAG: hypothetical protein EOP86_05395 [Verrucomicrobiaceae bacterium]